MPDGFDSIMNDRLDAWFDGQMTDAERSDFECQLATDPALRKAVTLQESIDDTLVRQFGERSTFSRNLALNGAASRIDASLKESGTRDRSHRPRVSRPAALAAALALVFFGGWLALQIIPGGGPVPYDPRPWRTFQQAYDEINEPEWICQPGEFEATFRTQYGQAIAIGELSAGVEALGLGYCNTLTPSTTWILAQAEGEKVVVFIDRVERDSQLPQTLTGDLRVHRRTLGSLVLYEVTPLDEPTILPALRRVEQSDGEGR